MTEAIRATFRKPFPEQVAAFRLRLGNLVPTARWDDLWQDQHNRAFMVAGATKADLLADLAAAVDKAIADGTGLEAFRKDFRAIVEKHGWHGWTGEGTAKGEAWRTKVIYRTNLRTSYMAGRYAQLVQGGFKFWIYRHGGSLEPRIVHLGWDGLILPPDHPFWAKHYPPNDWGCSCRVFGARTLAGAIRKGGKPGLKLPDGWDRLDPKTGAPAGIGKGWAYAPGASVAGNIAALNGKLPSLPAQIGARLFEHDLSRQVSDLDVAFAAFVEKSLSAFVQGEYMIVGALRPAWVDAAAARGVRIESAEIAVTDRNIQHTFRGTDLVKVASTKRVDRKAKVDPLDLDWYKHLPSHLRRPQAVLLDRTEKEPVFILVYDIPGSAAKLVIEINTYLKKTKGVMNTVQTGRLLPVNAIVADIHRGVELIDGKI